MPQDPKKNLTIAQSFSVNDDEKLAIAVLAKRAGVKAGTFVRQIFARGLAGYVSDRQVGDALEAEETFRQVQLLIESDADLNYIRSVLVRMKEVDDASKSGRVYSTPNLPDEAEQQGSSKKPASKKRNRAR